MSEKTSSQNPDSGDSEKSTDRLLNLNETFVPASNAGEGDNEPDYGATITGRSDSSFDDDDDNADDDDDDEQQEQEQRTDDAIDDVQNIEATIVPGSPPQIPQPPQSASMEMDATFVAGLSSEHREGDAGMDHNTRGGAEPDPDHICFARHDELNRCLWLPRGQGLEVRSP